MKFLLVLFLSSLVVHDYHVSNTLMNYNKSNQSLEITMKIFHDDLDHIREVTEEKAMDVKYQFDTDQYLLDNFVVVINGDSLPLNSLGREVENELVYCYFEVLNIDSVKSIEVTNTVLFDLFDDQTNMIDFELPYNQERILLTHNQPNIKVFNTQK